MRQPDFIGVGAQKCATTWVHRVLESHPDVAVSDPKELDFFSSHYDRGFDWYEKHFADSAAAPMAGETSPSYFYNPLAAERAQSYNPELKIIIGLRDPIERMVSNHLHEWRKGHLSDDNRSIEAAMARNPMYLHQSLYARHVKMWFDAFGRENVLILLQEEIAVDPKREAARLCEFLGVSASFTSEFFHRRANENVVYKNKAVGAVYAAAGRTARAAGLSAAINWAKRTRGLSALWSAAKKNVRDDVPPMRPETVAKLQDALAPEMQALADLMGVDTLPWPNWRAFKEIAA